MPKKNKKKIKLYLVHRTANAKVIGAFRKIFILLPSLKQLIFKKALFAGRKKINFFK